MIKKKAIIPVLLVFLMLLPAVNAPVGITLVKGTVIASKYGTLTVTQTMTMASMIAYANGTTFFNVTGFELSQHAYIFSLHAFGNGTWTIRFSGRIPITVTDQNALSTQYNYPWEQIQYSTSQTTPLIVIYANGYPTEPLTVNFRDDFLYTNPLLTTDWTIDPLFVPATQAGISTSSGYLIMTNQAAPGSLFDIMTHVSSTPVFTSSTAINGTIIKRKLTVAAIPFAAKAGSQTGVLRVGFTHLITAANAFPQSGTAPPYGTPNNNVNTQGCHDSSVAADNIGIEYVSIDNFGGVSGVVCGDPSATQTIDSLSSTYDPTKYTVATIETFGLFCSTCPDNAFPGLSWVWFRTYQEDSTGKIIAGTDVSFNQTTAVAPYFGTAPVYFFAQANNNGAVVTTKIDFVQWQNFGSPVCLVAPTGALCTRLPPNPGHLTSDFVGSIAWLATLLGGGDEQAGAIIMFLIMSAGMAGMPYLFTRNVPFASLGEMSVLGFNIYAGFLPSWVLFLVLLGGTVIVVMMVNRMIGGHSMGSFGSGGESG